MGITRSRFSLLALVLALPAVRSLAQETKDPRRLPITQAEVIEAATHLPLSSPQHFVVLSRANDAELLQPAYQEYLRRKEQHPKDFHANLLAGLASELYLEWLTRPSHTKDRSFSLAEAQRISAVQEQARLCLQKALEINPKSGIACTEYGHFLFFRGSKKQEGMQLLLKGVSLDKEEPRTHRLLGVVLGFGGSRSFNPFYDPQKAEMELKRAIQLDPAYAAPHFNLAAFYLLQHQSDKAGFELSRYIHLMPASVSNRPDVVSMQNELQKHTK